MHHPRNAPKAGRLPTFVAISMLFSMMLIPLTEAAETDALAYAEPCAITSQLQFDEELANASVK